MYVTKKVRVLWLALLASLPVQAFATTACPTGSGQIGFYAGTCYAEPTSYTLKIYQVGLCTSTPAAPTASTAVNLGNCTTIYENTGGASIQAIRGVATALPGSFARPANGAYTAGYVIVDPSIKAKASVQFSSSRKAISNSSPNGTGAYCWTRNGTFPSSFSGGTPPTTVECGSSPGTAEEMTMLVDVMEGGSFSGTAGSSTTAHLLKSNLTLATATSQVVRIFAVQPMSVNVSDATRTMDLNFKASEGLFVDQYDAGGSNYVVFVLTAGVLQLGLSVQ